MRIARELLETGADPVVQQIVARAVSDEVRHAEICRALARRYLARDVAWPPPGPVPLPFHGPASEALRPTLHITAMCCINETLATAWLGRSLADATAPLARAAVRALLADDIDHARAGWAHLASPHVTAQVRAQIAGWLPRLLEAARRARGSSTRPRAPRLDDAAFASNGLDPGGAMSCDSGKRGTMARRGPALSVSLNTRGR